MMSGADAVLAEEDEMTRAPLPRRLQIEVTGACNLRCRMCLVRYRPPLDRRTAAFPLDRFVALLDELPSVEHVTLQGLGEPLLHPDLVTMVEEASARRIRVGFNTNATLLTRPKAAALVIAGTDWLHVSVDGATAATFERIREGARFDRVMRNLRDLVDVRRELETRRPTIQLNTVLMRSNLEELPGLVHLAADVGVDRMWVQALSHDFSDTGEDRAYVEIRRFTESEALWGNQKSDREPVAEARLLADELGLALRLPDDGAWPEESPGNGNDPGGPELPCDWPWTAAYVTHDGKLQPCCMVMGEDRAVLGDLALSPFAEIWNGDSYRQFRAAMLSERPPDICRGCAWYRRVF